ncbi:MAG TPA: FlgD immunoglobulin-like domain containing protein, partial [Bacteroidota bacterium]|nr:FlgD immunoglobulin-like domain containing protein [Bacteroidota bacterium]
EAEPLVLATPGGHASVSFQAGAVSKNLYVTACDGGADPSVSAQVARAAGDVFTVGPAGADLRNGVSIHITDAHLDPTVTIAALRDGKWLALATRRDKDSGALVASADRLGVFGVMKSADVDGALQEIPMEYELYQNYPNPFNPSTVISYRLPAGSAGPTATTYVTLKVFDLLGRAVATLVDGAIAPGSHTVVWDGRDGWGQPVSSGMYIYQIRASNYVSARKMVLLK